MHFQEEERNRIVSRYAALYRALNMGDETGEAASVELLGVVREYEEGLPRLPLSRCPLTGEVQVHSFDPYGLDGPWWNCEAPARPLLERIASCIAVTGAVALADPVESAPFLCKPGPGLPYVYPRLLALDGVSAVVRQLPVGRHTAWAICYFADAMPKGAAMPNAWGTGSFWDAMDGLPGWYATPDAPEEWDFSLSPWIARGKLFWIAPDDPTLSLRTDIAGCPFIGLPGEQGLQRIAFGRVSVEGEIKSAAPVAAGEMIGDFALFTLQDDLRDELRLPPVPVPVRQSRTGEVFPSGGPVNLAAMLEEVQAFAAVNPEADGAYRPLLAGLGLVAGMAAAERGAHEEALRCFRAGLAAVPENVVLRSHEALALVALERHAEAREALEAIVKAVPRGEIMPLVWMLLVRRYVEDGEPARARPLLEDLSAFGGEDEAVAHFVAAMSGGDSARAKVAAPEAAVAESPPLAADPGAAPGKRKGLVLGLLLVLAAGLGGIAAWRVLGPGGSDPQAPTGQGSAPEPVATAAGTVPAAPSPPAATAIDAASAAITRELPGIWAPEEGGCATGFGFAFTPAGRYAEGDEYSGEEGRWSVVGGRLVATIELKYSAEDEVSDRKVESVSKRYDYEIRNFTANRMELVNGEASMAFVRCPEGRRMFVDGETYP